NAATVSNPVSRSGPPTASVATERTEASLTSGVQDDPRRSTRTQHRPQPSLELLSLVSSRIRPGTRPTRKRIDIEPLPRRNAYRICSPPRPIDLRNTAALPERFSVTLGASRFESPA